MPATVAEARRRVVAYAALSEDNRRDLYDYCFEVAGLRLEGRRIDSIEPEGLPSHLVLGYSDVLVATRGFDSLG